MYHYKGTVARIVDGDTWDIMVDLGFHCNIKIRVRLARIDAYERGTKKGKQATEHCINNYLGEIIEIHTEKTGKWGRWLGEIYHGGDNINDYLVELKLAKKYDSM